MKFLLRARHFLGGLPLLISLSAATCAAPEDEARDLEVSPPSPAAQSNAAPDSEAPPLTTDRETPSPSVLSFPYVVEPACPGEGCTYDEWLTCGTVPVYASLGDPRDPVVTLEANERFEVLTGAVVVDRPGIVAVTRPSRPVPFLSGEDIFQPGDTLYVLDYLGEGFYNTWFQGEFYETEQFWPGPDFFTAPDHEYGGNVVQEAVTGIWVQIRSANQREGV